MAVSRSTRAGGEQVDAFMQASTHPLKPVMEGVRALVLGIDPAIGEDIKWNAPSFYLREHFATLQLRDPAQVQVILHLGAKQRAGVAVHVDDPTGLLTWLGPQRASVCFADDLQLQAGRPALAATLRQWLGPR
ncbi:DUF1801 domain-containing protein [Pseudoxanthomonas composti]|uniref:DUF1801 domain-containing protein n=1 Tax=Pseudoxanthomonas composti TaxID=2137479 RepID=A0A4Q1JSB8_9GAMM|nr:DUF1801 domain-containing protein [Pseudoxanthomonas composti]RXQ98924.1 DUF1801 domain-containing protein [Pseudoxanthomonas composti]